MGPVLFLVFFALMLSSVAVWRLSRPRAREVPPAVAPGRPLPSALAEKLEPVCVRVAREALEAHATLLEIERALKSGQRDRSLERWSAVQARAEAIARDADSAVPWASDDEDDDVGPWLTHAIERAETIAARARHASDDGGGQARDAADARDASEDLLLAASDFAERRLAVHLVRRLSADLGTDRVMLLQRALARAEQRLERDLDTPAEVA